MGTAIECYPAPVELESKDEVHDWFRGLRDAHLMEFGSDPYSGSAATIMDWRFSEKIFPNRHALFEDLVEHVDKREAIMARAYLTETPFHDSRDGQRLIQQMKKSEAVLKRAQMRLYDGLVNRKAALVSCRHCTSRVRTSYLQTTACPVCDSSLLTENQETELARARDTIDAKRARVDKARRNYVDRSTGGRTAWFAVCGCSM